MGQRRAKRASPRLLPKVSAVPGPANRNRAAKHEDASAETFSILSPRWNDVPSVTRRSNCKLGFLFPQPATVRYQVARNLARKVSRAGNQNMRWFQKRKLTEDGRTRQTNRSRSIFKKAIHD